jgi:glycosyltransferase involved in cell wall biosynthesis
MIVQIFEPFQGGGHFTSYIRSLLQPLVDLVRRGLIQKVVVTISREHRESSAFADQLASFSDDVEFDASLPVLWAFKESPVLAKALLDSVSGHQTDYLVVTTADLVSVGLVARSLIGELLSKRAHTVGIFHKSYGQLTQHGGDGYITSRVKDEMLRFGRRFAPWSEVKIVNPLDYERLKRRGGNVNRVGLLPHPVDRLPHVRKIEARRTLQIPLDGRYIGCIGTSDKRKAIPELLSAFRAATTRQNDRLLLAGHLDEAYGALIDREFSDLVREKRLIVLNRYLTTDELTVALCALDVSAVAYYPGTGLSANLLQAACAGVPVIAGHAGYSGMAVARFKLGWSCDVYEHGGFIATIRTALTESENFFRTKELDRLTAFHDPSNYARSVLRALYERLNVEVPPLTSWEQVIFVGGR